MSSAASQNSEHPTSISAVLFGGDLDRFIAVWGNRGPIVKAVRRATSSPTIRQLALMDMSAGTLTM